MMNSDRYANPTITGAALAVLGGLIVGLAIGGIPGAIAGAVVGFGTFASIVDGAIDCTSM
eukprot:CAMPEP_0184666130 /NCGR_PEP_ID=MMETSP0308-20130426/60226_1 /TAXON_ID=38269 /ORGANISM="Gloeochaete witrockiana, Strain SAG 46.84" /LENGTH=59 /DNA_ID=CAMNT_0027110567 /DNA_START=203 /DNA_END=379 /DNA_ORIENTATION=-